VTDFDTILIGAGHNGLVCATLLARAGQKVLILDQASHAGGALRTREFAPGFKTSACAHLLHHFPASLIKDLNLETYGLKFAAKNLPTTALNLEGPHVTLHGSRATNVSEKDQSAYAAFHARLNRYGAHFLRVLTRTPPSPTASTTADKLGLLNLAWQIRSLGKAQMRDLLRIIGMNIHDLAEESFADPLLQSAVAFDAILGADTGPRTPGTVLTLLYRAALQSAAQHGLCQIEGGMGALGEALAAAATSAKAELRLITKAADILVENDHAAGVRLADNEIITAKRVISATSPRATFLQLLGAAHLDAGFTRRVHHIRARGHAAKLHLALSGEPIFRDLDPSVKNGRLLVAPSLKALEHAYNPIKYHALPKAPVMEIHLPTHSDPSLAPKGAHVLSATVQFVPHATHALPPDWRQAFTETLIRQLAAYASDLPSLVQHTELLMPEDIAEEFALDGGHWHNGEFSMDQVFFTRPVPGAAQYDTPLPGLFLCGAGSHPGGFVTGLAGENAARHILRHHA
jgi:phytoene dehydrogenase-like protein